MFCKQCGKELGNDEKRFCPHCGAAISTQGATAMQQPKSKNIGMVSFGVIGLVLLGIIAIMLAMNLFGNKPVTESTGTETVIEVPFKKSKAEMLLGTWRGEEFDITFNNKGQAKILLQGAAIGGDYISYELIDEHTLYISGKKLPAGITLDCYIDEDYLVLGLNGEERTFYKD